MGLLPNAGAGAGVNAGAVLAELPPNGVLPKLGAGVAGAGLKLGVLVAGIVAPALSPSFSCVRP